MKKWIDALRAITVIFAFVYLLGIIPHSRSIRTLLLVALPASLVPPFLVYMRSRFYKKHSN